MKNESNNTHFGNQQWRMNLISFSLIHVCFSLISLDLNESDDLDTTDRDHVTSTSNETLKLNKDTGHGESPTPSASSSHSAGKFKLSTNSSKKILLYIEVI